MSPRRGGPRHAFALACLALTAAGTRLVAQLHAGQLPSLAKYPQAARLLEAGAPSLTGERILDFSPLYLALAWGFEALGLSVQSALGWLQAAAGVAAVLLAAHLGRRLGGPVAGIAAGALLALDRMAVVAGTVLEPEIPLALLLLAGTAWSLPPEDGLAGDPAERRERARPLLAGLCFGLAALARPNALLAPVLLLGLALVAARRPVTAPTRSLPRPRPALLAAGVAFTTALLLLVVWLGGVHGLPPGQWPALMSPGQVFHQGNGPAATGFGFAYPPSVQLATERLGDDSPDFEHQAYRLVARAASGRCLTAVEAEGFWRRLALTAMADRPGWALERAARRLGGSLSRRQVWDVVGAPEMEARMAGWTPVGLFVLLPLTLAAFLPLRTRRETRVPWVVLPGLAVALVTTAVFFVSGRHRLLLDVFLTVPAGVGAAALGSFFTAPSSERRVRRGLVVALLLVVGALPFLTPGPVLLGRRFIALDQAAARLAVEAREAHEDGALETARQAGARALVLALPVAGELPPELARNPELHAEALRLATGLVQGGGDPEAARAATTLARLGGCSELVRHLAARPVPLEAEAGAAAYFQLAVCHLRGEAPPAAGRLALERLRGLEAPPLLARALLELTDPSVPIPTVYDPLSRSIARSRVLQETGRPTDSLERNVLETLRRAAACPASRKEAP
jgi:hypothetical protein